MLKNVNEVKGAHMKSFRSHKIGVIMGMECDIIKLKDCGSRGGICSFCSMVERCSLYHFKCEILDGVRMDVFAVLR